MADELSKRRRVENEVTFQAHNRRREQMVAQLVPAGEEDFPLTVVCECANEDCREKITVPLIDYRQVLRHPCRFILLPGHEQTDVEQIVREADDYVVVEKFEMPPPPQASQLRYT